MSTLTLMFRTINGVYRLPLTEAADLDGSKEVAVTYVTSNVNVGGATSFNIQLFHAPRNNASHYSSGHVTESGSISSDGVHNSYITQFSRYLTLKVEWTGTPDSDTSVDIEVLLVPKS